jgi:hypothetical protein
LAVQLIAPQAPVPLGRRIIIAIWSRLPAPLKSAVRLALRRQTAR